MKKILIIFITLLAFYGCKKNSTGPREQEYRLKLAIDYYGANITEQDSNAVSVGVYKTKADVGTDNVIAEYTGKNFLDELTEILIQKDYEVVITLNTKKNTDTTDINGDVPYDFDSISKELKFTMDGDKEFNIIFSEKPIREINITFTAGANGYIDVYVLNGSKKIIDERVSINGTAGTIALKEYLFSSPYTIEAKASGIIGYGISYWEDGHTQSIKQITDKLKTSYTADFTAVNINYGTPSTTLIQDDGWYQIWNKEDLLFLANEAEAGSAYRSYKYKIMTDIDYGGGYYKSIPSFGGVIDGNGYSIKNAKFSSAFISSMFSGGGAISNLTIESDVVIESTDEFLSAIVGYCDYGDTSIVNVTNKATINAYGNAQRVGGIMGRMDKFDTILENVYNKGDINYYGNNTGVAIGGILGYITGYLEIKNSYSTGSIPFNAGLVGGVVGYCNKSTSSLTLTSTYFVKKNDFLPDNGYGLTSPKKDNVNRVKREREL